MAPVFYNPDAALGNMLPEEESWHALKVMRLREGDPIVVVDGKGMYIEAKIISVSGRHCHYEIENQWPDFEKRRRRLHVAIAPPKQIERFEFFLEKATEIGIDDITPFLCSNSERQQLRPDRLEKILISAMKQSVKAYLPRLHPMVPFMSLMQSEASQKAIAHCRDGEKLPFFGFAMNATSMLILIGPEGDFTLQEIELAHSSGFTAVSLGNSRLRTETAALTAVQAFNLAEGWRLA